MLCLESTSDQVTRFGLKVLGAQNISEENAHMINAQITCQSLKQSPTRAPLHISKALIILEQTHSRL